MSDGDEESLDTSSPLPAFAKMLTTHQLESEARHKESDKKLDKLVDSVNKLVNISALDRKDLEQTRKDNTELKDRVEIVERKSNKMNSSIIILSERQDGMIKSRADNKKLAYSVIGTLIAVILIGAYNLLTSKSKSEAESDVRTPRTIHKNDSSVNK